MITLQNIIAFIIGAAFMLFAIILINLFTMAREAKRFNNLMDQIRQREKNGRDFTKGNTDSNN